MVITACPGDDDPDKTWTVTFDSSGGTAVASQTVQDGGTVSEPYSFLKRGDPTAEGLYPANKKATWKKGGTAFNFSDKITADTTLKAEWADQPAVTLSSSAATIVEKAVTYINANADKYILALNADVTVPSSQSITAPYADLEIIGLASERTITATANGTLFTVGKAETAGVKREVTTIALTVGNNITLSGKAANNNSVIWVRNGAVLTLNTGSKITGNSNSGATMATGYGAAAIHVDNADFIMNGGTITANNNANSNDNRWGSAGAVYAEDDSHVSLLGGSITDNTFTSTASTKDVYATYTTSLTVGGTVQIGELVISTNDTNTTHPIIQVTAFTGSGAVSKLNLRSNNAAAATYYNGKQIMSGVAAGYAKFTLGSYISQTTAAAITGKTIDATGRLN